MTDVTKVAILGGGMGSLATAWQLTNTPEDRERFQITVYQKDWLLGGKGASSRSAASEGARIEEHGIHLLLGFYDNALRVVRSTTDEARTDPTVHLPPFDDAIEPWDTVWLAEQHPVGTWVAPWRVDFPARDGTPGVTPGPTDPLQLFILAVKDLEARILDLLNAAQSGGGGQVGALISQLLSVVGTPSVLYDLVAPLAIGAIDVLLNIAWKVAQPLLGVSKARHAWISFYLLATNLRGILRDRILLDGTDPIDHLDYRDWLKLSQAFPVPPHVSWDSPPIQGFYDLAFSRKVGLAAGVALRALSRMAFGYPGHFCYKMRGGMGEVVFTPMYVTLRNRGVRFRFLHEATRISPTQSGGEAVVEQIELAHPTGADTFQNPLHTVDQNDGTKVDAWSNKAPPISGATPTKTVLQRGEDFDVAVIGIPPPGLPATLVGELKGVSPGLAAAIDNATDVATRNAQLWVTTDGPGLGWPSNEEGMLISYARPLMAWVDMSQVLPKEGAPPGGPQSVHYLCDEIRDDEGNTKADVRKATEDWLVAEAPRIWPNFTWSLLYDPGGGVGPARLDAQYYRANAEGSERYITVGPGSPQHRIEPSETGFRNLAVAGDWVRSELSAGCLEGATLGGLGAARAILDGTVKP